MREKSLINENPKYKVIIAKMVWKTSVFNEVLNWDYFTYGPFKPGYVNLGMFAY